MTGETDPARTGSAHRRLKGKDSGGQNGRHMKKVLVPEKNRPDMAELSKEITKGLEIVYVKTMDDVVREACFLNRFSGPRMEEAMIIRSVELETVCGITSKLPENDRPEFAFAGKSNVGKSSLINGLMNRKALARTSSQPGKTQTINFYNINEELYYVDLPGYGYAKVPLADKTEVGEDDRALSAPFQAC